MSGKTVAPRYMPSEVDLDLLEAQADAVCSDPLWIDDFPLCSQLVDSLDAADGRIATGDHFGARAAITSFRDIVLANGSPTGAIEPNASGSCR